MPERKHYGEVPPDGFVAPPVEDATTPVSITEAAVQWIANALQTVAGKVPNRLLLPQIQPVLEVFRPILRFIDVKDPAAGADYPVLKVPDGVQWEVLSVSCQLVTSAAVANRVVALVFTGVDDTSPAGIPFFATGGNFSQVASQTVQYHAAAVGMIGGALSVATAFAFANFVLMPLPPRFFLRGAVRGAIIKHVADFLTLTYAPKDPADQISKFRMVVLESPAIAA